MTFCRFLVAVLLASFYQLWLQARTLYGALREYRDQSQRVEPELKLRRLAACNECPIFFKPLATCGSPLAQDPQKGCHCFQPWKASIKSNCWAFEKGYETFGWPKQLNSFPEDGTPKAT